MSTIRSLETPEQSESRRINNARNMVASRNMETPEQAESRRRSVAKHMSTVRNMETPEQAECRRTNNARNMAFRRSSTTTIQINQNQIEVPQISKNVETEEAKKKAFYHMMKTKIENDELFSDEIRETINNVIRDPNNEKAIQIPIYEQCHQANVCVCCDRFICGTEDIYWIHKGLLLQQKRRLTIPNLNTHLSECYQVSDPQLHGLLLSPRARVKVTGEYMSCSLCYKALQLDKMDNNPPKFAISNNFAIGTLPEIISSTITDVTGPLLSPTRPFAYIMSYSGGAHKAISGSFSFFSHNVF